ncbi:MAG: hypothetical protein NPIRA06_08830 [Nitrospirales bacterium]|nr:MAG: hypothetical protein NPIRA06_08830 [Nitrospirales bacterium]
MDYVRTLLSQGWVGTVVGLAGIVLAIVFYLRSKRKAKLAFQHYHVTLVGGRGAAFPDEVEIRFLGTAVPRITASKIVIWNCGDRTINGSDVVAGDPLRLELSDAGRILKHTILRQTRSVNGWRLDQPAPNLLSLVFEFLDPGDGICAEVIHSEAGTKLDCKGTIKGMPAGMSNYGRAPWSVYRHRRSAPFPLSRPHFIYVIGVVFGFAMIFYGLLRPSFAQWFPAMFVPDDPIDLQKIRWGFVVGGLLYAAFPGFLLWSRRRRYPAVLEPTLEDGGDEQDTERGAAKQLQATDDASRRS